MSAAPTRPFTKETTMAEFKMHIRFVDPRRTYFGSSEYRPSEGWIDVDSYSLGSMNAEAVYVVVSEDPAVGHLYTACRKRLTIDTAILEMRNGVKWFRFVMNDVVVEDIRDGRDGHGSVLTQITLTYKERTDSYGGYPSARGQSAARAG